MKELLVNEIEGMKIGSAENTEAGTGCTVFLFGDEGAAVGMDVRGGGPASSEGELLKPLASAEKIHAVMLAGGSSFGLAAAEGVKAYLEERGIGYDTGAARIPLVCASNLYDLGIGRADIRPDAKMGYEACAASGNYQDGCHGVGTGATIGKLYGLDRCMKSGVGSYAVQTGDLIVGAVVAVNGYGDVYDYQTGVRLAGLLSEDHQSLCSTEDEILKHCDIPANKFTCNTTLGMIFTNAAFDKVKMSKIAGMAHDGFARSIRPVHTSADGDSIYAASLGTVKGDIDAVGTIAAMVTSEAIKKAVQKTQSGYGLLSMSDLNQK